MIVLAKVVDWAALGEAIWTAAVAGIGVSMIFSLAVIGFTRSLDTRRAGRGGQSVAYGVLAFAGVAGTALAIAFGIYLITS